METQKQTEAKIIVLLCVLQWVDGAYSNSFRAQHLHHTVCSVSRQTTTSMVAASIRTAMPTSSFLRARAPSTIAFAYCFDCRFSYIFIFSLFPIFFIREISCWPKRNTLAAVCIRQSSPPSLYIVACVVFNGIDVRNLPMHAFAVFVTEIEIRTSQMLSIFMTFTLHISIGHLSQPKKLLWFQRLWLVTSWFLKDVWMKKLQLCRRRLQAL